MSSSAPVDENVKVGMSNLQTMPSDELLKQLAKSTSEKTNLNNAISTSDVNNTIEGITPIDEDEYAHGDIVSIFERRTVSRLKLKTGNDYDVKAEIQNHELGPSFVWTATLIKP